MTRQTTEKVKEILSWYRSENNAVLTNLHKLLMTGALAGTGKMVIFPVDQGFEHGPARSFGMNELGYDARYHIDIAIETACNAYAAPYGAINAVAHDYIGDMPLIVKVNNSDSLYSPKNPIPAVTCSVKEALRIGACAIGFTIYPGSSMRKEMYQEIRELSEEARSYGMPSVVWSYPRGEQLSKDGETAIDVVSYGAHIACQLGAHIVKVKPPTKFIEQDAARKVFESEKIAIDTLEQRVKHVVQSCFNGRRVVIFSGGESKGDTEVMNDIRSIHAGGGFGSIMGRNVFQRSKKEGVKLLNDIISVYKK